MSRNAALPAAFHLFPQRRSWRRLEGAASGFTRKMIEEEMQFQEQVALKVISTTNAILLGHFCDMNY